MHSCIKLDMHDACRAEFLLKMGFVVVLHESIKIKTVDDFYTAINFVLKNSVKLNLCNCLKRNYCLQQVLLYAESSRLHICPVELM